MQPPVPELLFRRLRVGAPPEPGDRTRERIQFFDASRHIRRRLDQLESAFSDMPELRLDLTPASQVSVTGASRTDYALALWAETDVDDDEQAEILARQIALERQGDTFVVKDHEAQRRHLHVLYWDIVGPEDRPVTIAAAHAAIDVFGISAPVRISGGHGRVSVLECSGDVDVTAGDGGHVVWAGRQGRICLDASHRDGDIDLKLTDATFSGALDATARHSIRVLLPRRFASGIEANVGRKDRVICRADIAATLTPHEDRGRITLNCGSSPPVLRLTSLEGTVVIDNAP